MLYIDIQATLHQAATVVSTGRLHRAAMVVKGLKNIVLSLHLLDNLVMFRFSKM